MTDHEQLEVRGVVLQSGVTLENVTLAYKTYGTLNRRKDNVIVYPTYFAGRHQDNEWLIGGGRALDPARYFIIVPNMFGNGLSTSPSNVPPPHNCGRFPNFTTLDNVRLQHQLLTEKFSIDEIALAVGWSMGGQQAYHWAALYPNMVRRLAPFCSSARTSRHNFVFLDGVKAALTVDCAHRDGAYNEPPVKGLRAMGRVFAGWVFSQAYYREQLYLRAGFASLEDFLKRALEEAFLMRDANDLLAMLQTWQHADISANDVYGGNFEKALGAIRARAIVMPSRTDLYFPPEDNAYEVDHMPNAELRPIPSIWGHAAGAGMNPVDTTFIDNALKELLAA